MELKNLHEVMQDAADKKEQDDQVLITCSFKLQAEDKTLAHEICRQNGTTLSHFLRQTVERLIKEYVG